MDIKAIRRENLLDLEAREGSLKALAEKTNVNYTYLSTILNEWEARGCGDGVARKIEMAYHLPLGAMDCPNLDCKALEIAYLISYLPASEREKLQNWVRNAKT